MLLSGEADIGVATEALAGYDALVTLPCYRWTHSIVVPPGHRLLDLPGPVTLEQLAQYPIITYELGYTGRAHIDEAFAREGIAPDIVLTAMDADGTDTGFDTEMIAAVREVVAVPLIASGGAGRTRDFVEAVRAGADAVLAASVFHYGQLSIVEVKQELDRAGFPVRL